MTDEYVEVPVTRSARVTMVGRLVWYRATDVPMWIGAGDALKAGDQVVLKPYELAPFFRSGIGRILEDGRLDIREIVAACDGDQLYRVEPP